MAPSLADDDFYDPNLPGWRPRPAKPATFFKPQTLTFTNGGSNVESLPSQREREDEAQQRAEEARRAKKAAEAAAAAATASSIPAPSKPAPSSSSFPVPRYVSNAGVVLRYRGWFCDPVPAGSSRLEARAGGAGDPPSPFAFAPPPPPASSSSRTDGGAGARVRQVELRLYLEDNTADVVERREPNSGLEQGLIARRHALSRRALVAKGGSATTAPRRGGGGGDGDDGADPFAPRLKTEVDAPLRPEDIRVGDVIDVFGRRITVADADAATRAWLLSRAAGDERKSPSTDSSSSPSDSSSDSSSPQFARLPGDAIPVPEGDYEVAMRAAAAARELGKARSRAEISGNAAGARLWDRLPVPAGGWKPAPKALGEDDPRSIMARLFDGGNDKTASSSAAATAKSLPPLPPHNGFGSEEDSANSCLRLSPRARVRRAPLAADAGVEALFAARLVGPETVPGACRLSDGDAERRFSVRWTPADGAVAVFEERAPGYPGGKFLERNPVRRPACACDKSCRGGGGGDSFSRAAPGILACGACGGSRSSRDGGAGSSSPPSPPPAYYSEPDFYIGAPLRLHGRGFLLLAAEERALRRMETAGHPLARRWEAAAAARAALEAAAGKASSSAGSAVAFGGSELLREALAAVALQKREREEEKEGGDGPSPGRRGASPPTAIAPPPLPSPLLLLTPDELGEAFAAAGAPLDGPAQVRVTLARALGGSERPGNEVDAAEVVERLFG